MKAIDQKKAVNEYIQNTSPARIVIDFLAGMTDDYMKKCYQEDILLKKE